MDRERSTPASRDISASVLDRTLAGARKEGVRLFTLQRLLLASAATAAVLVSVRGIAEVVAPARSGSPALAIVLGLIVLAASAVFILGLRMRERLVRLTRDIQSLELARDALDHDSGPRVELHPYRTQDGDERPVVVVRTDDVRRLDRSDDDSPRPPRSSAAARVMGAIVLVLLLAITASLFGNSSPTTQRWTFVDAESSVDAVGFRVGTTRAGSWSIADDLAATGGRSLVNRVGHDDASPATLVASSVHARDLRAVTRCRVSGDGEGGGCGLVFRYVDEQAHHVARIDVDSQRIVLARVNGGTERILATGRANVQAEVWEELAVHARGDAIRVSVNGASVIEVDDVLPGPVGSVGLWVPSGSEAYFDELAIEVFAAAPQAVEVLPLLQRRTS